MFFFTVCIEGTCPNCNTEQHVGHALHLYSLSLGFLSTTVIYCKCPNKRACPNRRAPLTCVLQIFPKINFSLVSQIPFSNLPKKSFPQIEVPALLLGRLQYLRKEIAERERDWALALARLPAQLLMHGGVAASIVPSLLLSMGKGMRMSSYSLRAERVVGGCGGAAGPARPKQLSSSLISHDSVPANAELLNIIQGVPIISTPPAQRKPPCNLESKFCRGNFRNILSMHCVSNYRLSNCIDSSEEDRTE